MKSSTLSSLSSQRPQAAASRGLTLVELMVGLAIGLVISLAAAVAYLGSRSTAVATEGISQMNETGKFALDFIGREIQMAGFYPTRMPREAVADPKYARQNPGVFPNNTNAGAGNVVDRNNPAFDQGLFGCDGARFDVAARNCPAPVANAPDSIVVNYFTDDANYIIGTTMLGHTGDCNRIAVEDQPYNKRSITLQSGDVVQLPDLISNRIGLVDTQFTTADRRQVVTKSVACSGNGNEDKVQIYQPVFQGVDDLVIRYGVSNTIDQSPDRFYTAAEVTALPTMNWNGRTNATGWQRVTAVQVCVLVRSLSNSRITGGTAPEQYVNCRGQTVAYPSDGTQFKRFAQVFAVRNQLNAAN